MLCYGYKKTSHDLNEFHITSEFDNRAPDDLKDFFLRYHISYGRRPASVYGNIGVVSDHSDTVRLGVNKSSIKRLARKHRQTGSGRGLPRQPRSRVTLPAQDRHNRVSHLIHRFRTELKLQAPLLFNHSRFISPPTVHFRLREGKIRALRPAVNV